VIDNVRYARTWLLYRAALILFPRAGLTDDGGPSRMADRVHSERRSVFYLLSVSSADRFWEANIQPKRASPRRWLLNTLLKDRRKPDGGQAI
jgi:hypothetical protein